MAKRKAVDESMHSNEEGLWKLRREDDLIENSSSQEFYSNYNIKIILAHSFKGRIFDLDVDIIAYDSNKKQEEQWLKQQNKHIKKLKIDFNKFESKSLQEKFYIIGTKDSENQITSAVIIRCFLLNDNTQVSIIPVINYKFSVEYNEALNEDDIIMEHMYSFLPKRSCGSLINKKAVLIYQFMEILKIKIEGILDKFTNTEERINRILQAKTSAEDYIRIHIEILAQYPNCEHDSYGIEEEEEELTTLEVRTEEKENTGLTVKSKKTSNKKVSWSSTVIENEMGSYRARDREAIEIFAEALDFWDAKLFKEAKDKSVDFCGLLNYFDDKIKLEFWCGFNRNFARKLHVLEETDPVKKIIQQKKYNDFVNQVADGYNFLMDNMPEFLDKMQIEQDLTIRSLPEDRKQHEGADFIKVLTNDIKDNAIITDAINFKKIGAILECNSYSMDLGIVEVEEQKYSNCNNDENLIAFITEKPLVSKETLILRYSILFEKHLLKDFKDNSNTDASINALLMSESTTILSNMPACERPQTSSMKNSVDLFIKGISLLKGNRTGAPLIQHHQTEKFLVHARSIPETGSVQVMKHIGFAVASVSITDEKLHKQVLHYLRTGEAFDSVRSAMETGAFRIIIQPSVVYGKDVVPMLGSVQTFNEESRNGSAEVLYHTSKLSTESNIGIVAQFLDSSQSF